MEKAMRCQKGERCFEDLELPVELLRGLVSERLREGAREVRGRGRRILPRPLSEWSALKGEKTGGKNAPGE